MHTTLITGVSGFVGAHLAREMHSAGCRVLGLGLHSSITSELDPYVAQYYSCDLTDPQAISKLPLDEVDSVINLAGLANVGASFDKPELYKTINVKSLTVLCDRLVELGKTSTRVLAISTGAVYDTTQTPPFTEDSTLITPSQTNPYVESKLLMEQAAQQYSAKGLDCRLIRPFNHIGPGQGPGFLLPDLTQLIQTALAANQTVIKVGNLVNERDFTDVRDVARAYRLLALAPTTQLSHNIYNVCSGKPLAGQTILKLIMNSLGVEEGRFKVEIDSSKVRPNDPTQLYGDATRLYTDTDWKPEINTKQTVEDFLTWQAQQA